MMKKVVAIVSGGNMTQGKSPTEQIAAARFAAVLVVLMVAAAPASADLTQSGNLNMTAGGNDLLPGTGISFANHVWTGDGTRLNMGGYYIKNAADASGFTLNLASGGITNGGDLTTSRGALTITNAGSIDIGTLDTRSSGGGNITVTHKGSFSASTADSSATGYGNIAGAQSFTGDDTGAFTITNGGIQTYAYGSPSGNVNIQQHTSVSVTGGIITKQNNNGTQAAGSVSIGLAGHRIGGGVAISGGVDSHNDQTPAGGPVNIYAIGDIAIAGGVSTKSVQNGAGAAVTLDATSGGISISGGLDTSTTAYGKAPGNVTLAASGDSTVSGTVTLNDGYGDIADGTLTMLATKVNSVIKLDSLDLSKVSVAVLAPGSKCIVKGDLLGFSTNVTTQTQLRMPAGKRMYYYPDLANNAYLMRGKYLLASTNGTPAAGGTLMPYVSPGTVITLK
jgi:hypothetical protein